MNLLRELLELSENEHEKDFYHSLTKYDRTSWSHAQEYGFHHHSNKGEYHGIFCTQDGRGKVFKKSLPDNCATYTCQYDDDNLLDKHQRLAQILTAVKQSCPSTWEFVSPSTYPKCKDACFTVMPAKGHGDVDIHVRQDLHPSTK
jgi:hypothetical protein